jgi:hypothetical protein
LRLDCFIVCAKSPPKETAAPPYGTAPLLISYARGYS